MRSAHLLPVGILAFVLSGLACTSLLGELKVIPGGGDAASNADADIDGSGSTEAGSTDAGEDAADSGLVTYSCSDPPQRTLLTTLRGAPNADTPDRVFLFRAGSGSAADRPYRLLFNDLAGAWLTMTTRGERNVTYSKTPGRVVALQSYGAGLVGLFLGNADVSSPQALLLSALPDGSDSWTKSVEIDATIGSCVDRFNAALMPLNTTGTDVLMAWSYKACGAGGARALRGRHYTSTLPGANTNWAIPAGVNDLSIDFPRQAMAVGNNRVFVLLNVGDGPVAGASPMVLETDLRMGAPRASRLPLTPAPDGGVSNSFMMGMALASASDTFAGLGLFEANLQDSTSIPAFFVGHVSVPNLSSLVPQSALMRFEVAKIGELPVDQPSVRWDRFPSSGGQAGEWLTAISRSLDGTGVNFIWWDREGRALARNGGANAFLKGTRIYGVDITLESAPLALLSQFRMVYFQDTPLDRRDAGGPQFDLWSAEVTCLANR